MQTGGSTGYEELSFSSIKEKWGELSMSGLGSQQEHLSFDEVAAFPADNIHYLARLAAKRNSAFSPLRRCRSSCRAHSSGRPRLSCPSGL